jgi:hypothetical protein
MKRYITGFTLTAMFLLLAACSKDPGQGGSSSIYGKVWVRDYNTTYTMLMDEYYGQEIDVYIIYGEDKSYSDRTRTSYDGSFEFKYLRKGTYHIYAYSKDSTLQTLALIPVIKDVEITKNRQEVEAQQITILN